MLILEQVKNKLGDKVIDIKIDTPRRVYLTLRPKDIREATRVLFKVLGFRFITATGIDTPKGFEILYHFSYDRAGMILSVKVLIEDKKEASIDSLATLFPGAEWIEREMWEMLGINFTGHPDMKRLLLNEDWPEGKFPLRHEHES
ncbi:MAG: NADH-quinone oxidoreductase subunit C [Candidatus Omnitrophota bacterium]|nr:NADH-quinone oxidoreductase subunit C [Candidatus Omnitrophota bacterium]MDD5655100.1 NADH-quinone oxidoreductase subunit C [Candidatus Omnitrophota bacterium]